MKKVDRQKVFDKYGGRCAYCGCELEKGWHVDELEPCRRKYRTKKGHYVRLSDKKEMTEAEVSWLSETGLCSGEYKWVETKTVFDGYEHPERMNIDNQVPACASCNINKHSQSLEEFRQMIAGFIKSLNRYSVQYKIAKRYGLVQEIDKPVVFYFENQSQFSEGLEWWYKKPYPEHLKTKPNHPEIDPVGYLKEGVDFHYGDDGHIWYNSNGRHGGGLLPWYAEPCTETEYNNYKNITHGTNK